MTSIDWHKVASTDFWFQIDPARIHPSEQAVFYVGAVAFIIGMIILIISRLIKNQFLAQALHRFSRVFVIFGIVEAIWYLMRFENTQVLGTRFVAALIALLSLIYLYSPIRYLLKNYKEDMARAAREASRDKYLNYRK